MEEERAVDARVDRGQHDWAAIPYEGDRAMECLVEHGVRGVAIGGALGMTSELRPGRHLRTVRSMESPSE
jgi:hypothetical protein